MRYPIIDGFRGFFLLFMMIVHLNEVLDTILGKLNHHYLGWVEDAQGFVFISGVVVGLVYGGLLLRRSAEAMTSAIRARMRTIWSHQAGLILLFLIAAFLLPMLGGAGAVLEPYRAEPFTFTVASLVLVAASMHMGILPMYIWMMTITPMVLRAFARGMAPAVLVLSALLWMTAQTGVVDLVTAETESLLVAKGYPMDLGIFFNLLGWQVLFFGGLWLGFLTAQGRLDLSFLKGRGWTAAALISMGGVAAFALLDRIIYWDMISVEFSSAFLMKSVRQDFSPVHLINFALDLFLLTWLIVAGQNSGIRFLALISNWVTWLFTRKALVFLGQHSLHVFSFHILVVYIVTIIFEKGPPDEITGSILIIMGALSLYIPAVFHASTQSSVKRITDKTAA